MKPNLKKEILFFLYNIQVGDRKLLRSIGNNYDFTGRRITDFLDNSLVKVSELPKKYSEKYIMLTEEGEKFIFKNFDIDPAVHKQLKLRSKGSGNKYRTLKLGMSLTALYKYFPEWCFNYQSLEKRISAKQPIDFKDEIAKRKSSNNYSDFLFTTRELRDIHSHRLKNISATRAQGVFTFGDKLFVFFNHNRKRMRKSGEYEEKFKDYVFQTFEEYPENAIHFGRSFKVALDTFNKSNKMLQTQLIIDSTNYQNNYYVPLTHQGVNQLMVYTIPDFKTKISEAILTEKEILGAKNTAFDGRTDDDTFIYFGFECNLSEIKSIYYSLDTIYVSNDIVIYCFPHQSEFYKKLFGDRCFIKILTVEDIVDVLKEKKRG